MSKQTQFDKVTIFDVDIDVVTNTEAIDYICSRAAPGQPPAFIIKPYVEFLDRAYKNRGMQDLLNSADLAVADGVALNWAAAFLYAGPRTAWRFWLKLFQIIIAPKELLWPLPDRAAGTTFTWPLLQEAAMRGLRVFLIGSPKTNPIAHTASTLTASIPGLRIVGTHGGRDVNAKRGTVSPEWVLGLKQNIEAASPDLILVGMGFPLQEQACGELVSKLGHGVLVGEGGTFDYEQFGGQVHRAPTLVSRLGLEWAWRLVREPSRIVRQLAVPRYVYHVWRDRR